MGAPGDDALLRLRRGGRRPAARPGDRRLHLASTEFGQRAAGKGRGELPPSGAGAKTGIGLAVGQEAPDFTTKDTDGIEFKLSDYRGKVVVIDDWGFW